MRAYATGDVSRLTSAELTRQPGVGVDAEVHDFVGEMRAREEHVPAEPSGVHELLDLLDRESERAEVADHLHAPDRRRVEEAVVRLAAAGAVDQTQPFELADRLRRHARAAGELADGHRPFVRLLLTPPIHQKVMI